MAGLGRTPRRSDAVCQAVQPAQSIAGTALPLPAQAGLMPPTKMREHGPGIQQTIDRGICRWHGRGDRSHSHGHL